jgi:tetratricopeptide (TPR) repeat protein
MRLILLLMLLYSSETDYFASENILRFADYLFEEGDYLRAAGEYERWLFFVNSSDKKDAVLYKIGLCFELGSDFGRALEFYRRVSWSSHLHGEALYRVGYLYFAGGQHEKSVLHLRNSLQSMEGSTRWRAECLIGVNLMKLGKWGESAKLFASLGKNSQDKELMKTAISFLELANMGSKLPRKKPTLAAFLSSILPGLGKVYTRRAYDGLYSVTILGTTGLLSYSGFRKDGVTSTKGCIFGLASGVFYLGNIYGSAISARVYNQRVEDEFWEMVSSRIEILRRDFGPFSLR